jgi:hypothetical protein
VPALLHLQATLDASNGALALPLIKNKKTVNPRDSSTPAVFQLETAMGSGEGRGWYARTVCSLVQQAQCQVSYQQCPSWRRPWAAVSLVGWCASNNTSQDVVSEHWV